MSSSARFVMPASGSAPELLVDTSAAVALLVVDHDHHEEVRRRIGDLRLGLAGHAAFETFSVLTRLPPPARRTAAAVTRLLAANFPGSRFLGAQAAVELLGELDALGVSGGAVYDALVGGAAREHGFRLATRDRRALETYRALDIGVELLA